MTYHNHAEYHIGERFRIGTAIVECAEDTQKAFCDGCFFDKAGCHSLKPFIGPCAAISRKDHKNVIFKLIK